MRHLISTRDAFEGRLKTMSGLEFIVAQEPAETGPGMGTGVWVINKQTRRKRQNEEDEIIVHATYFMVGDKVFQAPSVADVMSARMVSSKYQSNAGYHDSEFTKKTSLSRLLYLHRLLRYSLSLTAYRNGLRPTGACTKIPSK